MREITFWGVRRPDDTHGPCCCCCCSSSCCKSTTTTDFCTAACLALATCEKVRRRAWPAIEEDDPRLRAVPISTRGPGERRCGESGLEGRARGESISLIFRPRFPGTGMPAGSPSEAVGSVCPPSLAASKLFPINWRTLLVLKRLDHDPREDMDERDKLATGEDAGCTQVGDWPRPSFHERMVGYPSFCDCRTGETR